MTVILWLINGRAGWHVIEIDGHSVMRYWMLEEADKVKGQPTVIVAHTVKGKAFSSVEHNAAFQMVFLPRNSI